ncbi:hypothetical protein OSTOST_02508, partial [Ostertagia ostertagi]
HYFSNRLHDLAFGIIGGLAATGFSVVKLTSAEVAAPCYIQYIRQVEELISVKRAYREIRLKTTCPDSLARPDGTVTYSQEEMAELICNFYSNLFGSQVKVEPTEKRCDGSDEGIPPILRAEVLAALGQMKKGKAPGPDRDKPQKNNVVTRYPLMPSIFGTARIAFLGLSAQIIAAMIAGHATCIQQV